MAVTSDGEPVEDPGGDGDQDALQYIMSLPVLRNNAARAPYNYSNNLSSVFIMLRNNNCNSLHWSVMHQKH